MNYRAALTACAALALLAGCKASNNAPTPSPTATRAAAPTSLATVPRTPPPLPPTPARSSAGTSAPRVGVAGQVVVGPNGFAPSEITVQVGRPVTFLNTDSVSHRVVSAVDGVFDTGDIAPGGSASVTVTVAGFTDFHDAALPARTGTITTFP